MDVTIVGKEATVTVDGWSYTVNTEWTPAGLDHDADLNAYSLDKPLSLSGRMDAASTEGLKTWVNELARACRNGHAAPAALVLTPTQAARYLKAGLLSPEGEGTVWTVSHPIPLPPAKPLWLRSGGEPTNRKANRKAASLFARAERRRRRRERRQRLERQRQSIRQLDAYGRLFTIPCLPPLRRITGMDIARGTDKTALVSGRPVGDGRFVVDRVTIFGPNEAQVLDTPRGKAIVEQIAQSIARQSDAKIMEALTKGTLTDATLTTVADPEADTLTMDKLLTMWRTLKAYPERPKAEQVATWAKTAQSPSAFTLSRLRPGNGLIAVETA